MHKFLIYYLFVTANMESSSFSIHSVQHRGCFYRFDKKNIKQAYLAVIVIVSTIPKKSDIDYILFQKRFLPHCNRIYSLLHLNISQNMSKPLELLLINTCHCLKTLYSDQGKVAETEAIYFWTFARKKKVGGLVYVSMLDTVNNLENLYLYQDKVVEAEAIYLWTLSKREKVLGLDDTSTLSRVMEGFYILWERHPCIRGAPLHPESIPVSGEYPYTIPRG